MKLTQFNSETLPLYGRTRLPRVSFIRSGNISLNGAAIELMQLKPECKLAIAQDQDNPGDWYIFEDDKGFKVRSKDIKKTGQMIFSHKELVTTFVTCFGLNMNKTYSFLLAGEPTMVGKRKYYGILTGVGVVEAKEKPGLKTR